jgi:hypothetical protein
VVPVLVVLVLGIVDYGIYFSDSLGLRDGVRQGARQGSVENFGGCDSLGCLADTTKEQIGAIGGDAEVRAEADDWTAGEELVVCAVVVETSVTGFTPLPGPVHSVVRTRIERDETNPGNSGQTGADPTGENWQWCD